MPCPKPKVQLCSLCLTDYSFRSVCRCSERSMLWKSKLPCIKMGSLLTSMVLMYLKYACKKQLGWEEPYLVRYRIVIALVDQEKR